MCDSFAHKLASFQVQPPYSQDQLQAPYFTLNIIILLHCHIFLAVQFLAPFCQIVMITAHYVTIKAQKVCACDLD